MHSRRRAHLTVHAGGAQPAPAPTAEQLRLGEHNHPTVQARMRAVLATVRAGTYQGRDGAPRPFQARHRELVAQLCLYADRSGEVRPEVITLGRLADELGRDKDNVNTDARQLEAALVLWRRPVVDDIGRRFIYVIPGMVDLKLGESTGPPR